MRDVESFSAGSVLRSGFSIYFRNLPLFALLTAIAFAPYGAYKLWSPFDPLSLSYTFADGFVALICGALVQGGLTYGVVASLRGNADIDLRTMFMRSLGILPRIVILSLVVSLIILAGFVLLIVPGLILALVLYVAIPVSVMEGGGIGKALKRSSDLTDGYKGQLFLVSLAIIVPVIIVSVVVVLTVVRGLDPMFGQILEFVISQFLLTGLFAACVAVAYHDLRILKDGVDTESIAAAFE